MPYSGEADAANMLLALLLLVGQAEQCNDSLAEPIPAITAIGSTQGKLRTDKSGTHRVQRRASRKCRAAPERSTGIVRSQQKLRFTASDRRTENFEPDQTCAGLTCR